jgi:hypothetical protein
MINDRFHKNNKDTSNNINVKNTNLIQKAFDKLMKFIKNLIGSYNTDLLEEIVEDITRTNIEKLDLNKDIYSSGVYYSLDYRKTNNSKLESLNIRVSDYENVIIESNINKFRYRT